MARYPAGAVIVGPSRYLPWPLDAIAHRAWDEAAPRCRRWRHLLPVPVDRALAASIELAQRPRLALWRPAGDGGRLLVASNDVLLVKTLFEGLQAGTPERVGRMGAWVTPHSSRAAELLALQIPSPAASLFAKAGWLVLPRWVELDVDLTRPERELWDSRKHETIRRVERSGFELEVTRELDAVREFHQRMYEPTARARHGQTAFVLRPGYVQTAVRAGWLVLVKQDGVRRAGLLLSPRAGRERALEALLFGVADGDYASSELAREAAYLFAMRWARDRLGASRFGLTGAAPFVHDGTLRFKKRWGATALPEPRQSTCIALRLQKGSPELAAALAARPFIVMRPNNGQAALSALVLRAAEGSRARVPDTPGIELAELEFQSASELPELLDSWARRL